MAKKQFFKESELVFEVKPIRANFSDIEGRRFGKLTVVGFAGIEVSSRWFCKCDCGNLLKVRCFSLLNDETKSCGCLQKSIVRDNSLKHGHAEGQKKSKIYSVWISMIQRCTNSKNKYYANYGARGITVCERWLKFENFLEDMGECPDGLTLERKENNGNYEKSNCKWATMIEQANNKTNSRFIIYKNEKLSARQWDRKLGLTLGTTWSRIFVLGWSKQRALNKNE